LFELAGGKCEYCRAPQSVCGYVFHLEHVIARRAGGSDDLSNRAFSCSTCNLTKGDRLQGQDPLTGTEIDLFHPRKQNWAEHFRWADDRVTLLGRTPTGRATVGCLNMNNKLVLGARRCWLRLGEFP
jgi:hypothetical protein